MPPGERPTNQHPAAGPAPPSWHGLARVGSSQRLTMETEKNENGAKANWTGPRGANVSVTSDRKCPLEIEFSRFFSVAKFLDGDVPKKHNLTRSGESPQTSRGAATQFILPATTHTHSCVTKAKHKHEQAAL